LVPFTVGTGLGAAAPTGGWAPAGLMPGVVMLAGPGAGWASPESS
jgi:hypothetical protein